MLKIPTAVLVFLCISLTSLSAQHFAPAGGGEVILPKTQCVSAEDRASFEALIKQNITELTKQGLLKPDQERSSVLTKFSWPLQQAAGFDQPSYYNTTNFVDLDLTSGLQDYFCDDRTYDGHHGIDYSLWPFWWKMMDENHVEVVAGAAGVIVAKQDGNFDRNCSCTGTWNAVAVQHPDGSIAWYGHLKNNTLTAKQAGETVQEGEYLGLVGSSGCSSNPHLHFEVRQNNNTIEPYQGNCNQTTPDSWWKEQKPFFEPTLNMIMTHSKAPEFTGFCPEDEDPDFYTSVEPGTLVRFAAYYHDQTQGTMTSFVIRDDQGHIFNNWNHSSPGDYSSSYWYWESLIPLDAKGTWTFEANYFDQSLAHEFEIVDDVSSVNSNLESEVIIFPNPTDEVLNLQGNLKLFSDFELMDVSGKVLLNGKINEGTSQQLSIDHLNNGVYFFGLKDEKGNIIFKKKIIKLAQ